MPAPAPDSQSAPVRRSPAVGRAPAALRPAPTWAPRACWALVLSLSLGVPGLAATLSASPGGYGTHTQLGLAPCAFRAALGLPCPACGLTTSFAHLADGALGASWRAHPLGWLLLLLLVAAIPVAAHGIVFATDPRDVAGRLRLPRVALLVSLALACAWALRLLSILLA